MSEKLMINFTVGVDGKEVAFYRINNAWKRMSLNKAKSLIDRGEAIDCSHINFDNFELTKEQVKRANKPRFVYMIKNTTNNKRYIGISTNFKKRKQEHLRALKRGVHSNKHLQNDFNYLSEKPFSFKVIKIEKDLYRATELENKLISKYKNTTGVYNIITHSFPRK